MKFVPKGPINNIPALVQIMTWRRSGGKPVSEPMLVSLPMHICVTRPQWFKTYGSKLGNIGVSCRFAICKTYGCLIKIEVFLYKYCLYFICSQTIKISTVYEIHIFWYTRKIFFAEFKILYKIFWKIDFSYKVKTDLRARKWFWMICI